MYRQSLVLLLLLSLFGLVCIRLFYWQVVQGSELSQAALGQYYFTLNILPARGDILDREGNPLVTNKGAYLAYAEPQKIVDRGMFVKKVVEILELDEKIINERLDTPHIVWALLKHKVSEDTYQKLDSLHLAGLGFEKESMRYYPEASMAAQLLGFVGSDSDGNDKGYFGLEGFYDRALKGKSGSLIQEKDARGLPILLGETKRIAAENGQSLKLYLDRTVQFILEKKLAEGVVKYGAKEGLVTVMDPKTGGILGVAAYPAFDQRDFSKWDPTLYPNPLVAGTYEPGSTFKTVMMSAGLNERVIDPKTEFNEDGPVKVDDYFIKTWNNEYRGKMTMTDVLVHSSNPGMVSVSQKLGKNKELAYIKDFGFGLPTKIDMEGEQTPELRNADEWKAIDLATASFGQGIAVTPIQMLRAVGAIANDGVLMEPHIVQEIVDQSGKVIEIKSKKVAQVIRSATAHVMTEMMMNAVDNGEAKWAKPKGYRIAGKTGTAQIPIAGHYDDKKTIASFIGFAPANDPKFVMLVILREPTTSPWGSETAAPLFFNVAKELFAYYGISPSD